jgi:hypothetical protein
MQLGLSRLELIAMPRATRKLGLFCLHLSSLLPLFLLVRAGFLVINSHTEALVGIFHVRVLATYSFSLSLHVNFFT